MSLIIPYRDSLFSIRSRILTFAFHIPGPTRLHKEPLYADEAADLSQTAPPASRDVERMASMHERRLSLREIPEEPEPEMDQVDAAKPAEAAAAVDVKPKAVKDEKKAKDEKKVGDKKDTDRKGSPTDKKKAPKDEAKVEGTVPTFTMKLRNRIAKPGSDAKLTVKLDGKPKPTITWFKAGKDLKETGEGFSYLMFIPVDLLPLIRSENVCCALFRS